MKDALAAKDASFAFGLAHLKELETKVTQLEGKVARLEEKELQQELLIVELQKETNSSSPIGKQLVGRIVSFLRTCQELRASDPSLTSGMHWIDPDGQNVGDDPIFLYCSMTTGKLIYILPSCYCHHLCADDKKPKIYTITNLSITNLSKSDADHW